MFKTEEQANIVKSFSGRLWKMLRIMKIEKVINIEAIFICNSCAGHTKSKDQQKLYYHNRLSYSLRQVPKI